MCPLILLIAVQSINFGHACKTPLPFVTSVTTQIKTLTSGAWGTKSPTQRWLEAHFRGDLLVTIVHFLKVLEEVINYDRAKYSGFYKCYWKYFPLFGRSQWHSVSLTHISFSRWNHAFKNQITTLQGQAKNRSNPNRSEVQANLSLFLEAASGFYTQVSEGESAVTELERRILIQENSYWNMKVPPDFCSVFVICYRCQ